jgi:uncharacterized protein YdeI (YjbR/CyaY-like superfamily)
MKIVYFPSSSEFRKWLQQNHLKRDELLVGFYKKGSGRPSVTYSEALDEALCYGWIDGVRKRVDDSAYSIRFSPRKAKSRWSAVNIERVRQLTAEGRMQPAGLKAFAGAKEQPRAYSYEQRHAAKLAQADEQKFRANQAAWEFFQAQPPGYRRTITFWVISAKKEETRQRRLATLIDVSARERIIDLLTGKPVVPKRKPRAPEPS